MIMSTNATPLSHEAREALRRAAFEILATRPGVALPLSGVRRRIEADRMVDFPFFDPELRGALSLLSGLGHCQITHDGLGATEYFQATATGVLTFERGQ